MPQTGSPQKEMFPDVLSKQEWNTVASIFLTIRAIGKILVPQLSQKEKNLPRDMWGRSHSSQDEGRITAEPETRAPFHFLLLLTLMFSIFWNCYIFGVSKRQRQKVLCHPEPCKTLSSCYRGASRTANVYLCHGWTLYFTATGLLKKSRAASDHRA